MCDRAERMMEYNLRVSKRFRANVLRCMATEQKNFKWLEAEMVKRREVENKCRCGATMAKIYSQGEFKEFCPVCRPDPFDRAEDQRMDAMDIQQEMEVDDEC